MRSARSAVLTTAAMVFCLALGVILGSGPLRTALVGQSAAEAERLRDTITQRDGRIDSLEASLTEHDAFLEALGPVVIADRLAGVNVVIVSAPGVGAEQEAFARAALEAAGATVVGDAQLGDAWFAAEHVAFRNELAEQVRGDVALTDAASGSEAVLQHALVQALLPTTALLDPSEEPALALGRAGTLREVLVRSDLLTIDLSEDAEAGAVVLLYADPSDDAAQNALAAASFARLAGVVDTLGRWVVIASGPSDADGVAGAVASQSSLQGVSVVADAWVPRGGIVLALALREQVDGGSGVYGADGIGRALPRP